MKFCADIQVAQRFMTVVILWLFIERHQEVKLFTNPVKYLNIYQMDWRKLW